MVKSQNSKMFRTKYNPVDFLFGKIPTPTKPFGKITTLIKSFGKSTSLVENSDKVQPSQKNHFRTKYNGHKKFGLGTTP